MTPSVDTDELRRMLIARGDIPMRVIDRWCAEQRADITVGDALLRSAHQPKQGASNVGPPEAGIACRPSPDRDPAGKGRARRSVPIKSEAAVQREVVVPWSCLASDNKHRSPLQSRADHRIYKLAREMTRFHARQQLEDFEPLEGDVIMRVRVFEPNRRRRDIANLLKCLCDGLKGVCYADDAQIAELTIRRGPVDVDRPNATITVEAIDACS